MGIAVTVNLDRAVSALCEKAGVDGRDARLLRLCANAVYQLPRESAVIRLVPASPSLVERAVSTVRLAAWLEQIDFPAVRLLSHVPAPVVADGFLGTFWQFLPQKDHQPKPVQLAPLLVELHDLMPPFSIPEWDPVADARRRLRAAGDSDAVDFLSPWCDRLEDEVAALDFELPTSLIHGDAWAGNLLWSDRGVVLSDLDGLCAGPPEWDLVPTVVNAMRFGRPSPRSFLKAYGFDVTAWPGFAVLQEVRELTMLTGVLPALDSSPSISREFARRIADLREGTNARWAPYQ